MNALPGPVGPLDDRRNIHIFNLHERNAQAEVVIRDYARGHAMADVGIGLVGTILPGAAIPAMIASIAMQAPLVYQPMAQKLSAIYGAEPDLLTQKHITEAAIYGGIGDLAAELASEFLAEIAGEILFEAGLGAAGAMIPLIGGVIAMGIDATIAATLTWRVGTMISIYHQNGSSYIENRKTTYHRASAMVGGLSPATDNRVRLDDIPLKNPEVQAAQMAVIKQVVDMLISVSAGKEQIRAALIAKGVAPFLIEQALKQANL